MPVARSWKVTSQIIVIVYINSNMKTLGVQSIAAPAPYGTNKE